MFKLTFYVPESHLEETKQSIFDSGGGCIGSYDCCSWQVKGEGQFRPLDGSDPFIGGMGELSKISEYRVELVVGDSLIEKVVSSLKLSHPYEEPAYDVIRLEDY